MTNQNYTGTQNNMSKSTVYRSITAGVFVGMIISFLIYTLFLVSPDSHSGSDSSGDDSNEPLYWVAPMDPNFKRDKPGKSPMGMDLIPVYEEQTDGQSPGLVSIDPVTVQNMGVRTASVKTMVPEQRITTIGQVQYAEDSIEHVHARVEGWVETLNVRAVGDYIEKGEELYTLYSPELINAQEELVIALRQNNKGLIDAAKLRLQTLGVSQQHINRIVQTRQVDQTITFLAPQSGYVHKINIQQGFYVNPSITMLSIASLERVWVVADVFPNDAANLTLGQYATINSDYLPGKRFDSQLSYIYPSVDPNTRTAQVRFELSNADRAPDEIIKPGMFTQVSIEAAISEAAVIAVPKQAVIRTGNTNRVVLVMGEGKYKSINVRLGRSLADHFEVLEGLDEGDQIVTSAHFLIDSESSISSDFARMSPPESEVEEISDWTQATVNEVLYDRGMVNITHGPLDAFNMMGMTMNFTLAESIEITDFKAGMDIHIEVIKDDSGMYQIKTVHFVEEQSTDSEDTQHHGGTHVEPETKSAWTHATVNAIDQHRRRVNLTHGYLDAFDMMSMTMDFTVAEAIDMQVFEVGASIHVEIIRAASGMFEVRTVHKMAPSDSEETEKDNPHKHHHGGAHE